MAKITLDESGLAQASGMMTVYNFDGKSGEFTGATDEYLPRGVGVPANACSNEPPDVGNGFVAIYREGNWQTVADHRGETVYSTVDGAAQLLTEPGEFPAGTTTLKPATRFDKWGGVKWVTDEEAQSKADIDAAEKQKAALISEAREITQAWQTQLLLGIITETDKASLTAWMTYIQKLQAVDISKAPSIIWPEKP